MSYRIVIRDNIDNTIISDLILKLLYEPILTVFIERNFFKQQ